MNGNKMDNFDVADALVQRGLKPEIANQIKDHVKGTDLVNLINALQSNTSESVSQINDIISKFGTQISIEEDEYLNAMYDNEDVDNLNHLKELDNNTTEDVILSKAGFKYEATIDKDKTDSFMDWLDENNIDYITDGNGTFNIKCNDRETLYKINQKVSKLKSKLIRDEKEKAMSSNTNDRKSVNEGVMGLVSLQPINRLMELAGIKADTVTPISSDSPSDDMDDDVVTTIPDDSDDMGMDDDMDQDIPTDVPSNMDGIDSEVITPEACSPAMNQINDYLNNIQTMIPDIKMSEYKPLMIKVQDLNTQVQSMGRGYLGERKLKR